MDAKTFLFGLFFIIVLICLIFSIKHQNQQLQNLADALKAYPCRRKFMKYWKAMFFGQPYFYTYHPRQKYSPAQFILLLECQPRGRFTILKKKDLLHSFFVKLLFFFREIPCEQTLLKDGFNITSSERSFTLHFLSHEENSKIIKQLFDLGTDELYVRKRSIRIVTHHFDLNDSSKNIQVIHDSLKELILLKEKCVV